MSAVPVEAGFRDFAFGSACNSTPSGEKPESKLWYNDGFWWGSLCTPSNVHHIYRLDLSTQTWVDTGVALDPRPTSKADTLWDGQKLYVVSGLFTSSGSSSSSQSQWSRLYRYSYNTATDTYSLDSGFPINVSRGRPEAITVAKDSTGTLWVTYTESSRVKINHSRGSDTDWGSDPLLNPPSPTPFDLPVPNATGLSSDDISAVIAYEGQILVMWSNQITKNVYVAVHQDGDGDAAADWQSGIANKSTGNFSDDHINLKALPDDPAGTVFAAVKTNLSGVNQPEIALLVCNSAALYDCASTSNWQEYLVYEDFDHTRPVLTIDTTARRLRVFSTDPTAGGVIYSKESDLDSINFPGGQGTVFIQNPPDDLKINNASSSKHNVNGTMGLAVLASDQTSRFYLHNHLALGGTPTPDIGVTPPSHNYGSVAVGASVSHTFVVSNTGAADLSVSATTLTGTDPGQFSIVSGGAPFTVTPGQTQNVVVSFNPTSEGAKSASLEITSDDPDENPLTVPLSGTGVTSAPDIGVSPTSHNYGSVVVGTSALQTFVVSNTGTVNLSVSATTLTGTHAGQFSIVSGGGSFTLTPGQTRNLVVSFNPSSLGAKSMSLSIASNNPDENPLLVALSGTGVTTLPAATHEETRTGASSGLGSVATTTALTGVTGHLYLAAISTRPNVTVSGVSGLGLTWTQVATQCSGRNVTRATVFRAQGTPSGNGVATAAFSSTATNAVISVSRYSGASTTDPIGNVIAGNTLGLSGACSGGTDSNAYSFNLTTTVAGALVYGAAAERNRTHTPGASYTERSDLLQGSGGDTAGIATEDRSVTSASTVAVNGTFSGTVDWAVVGVEIKAAPPVPVPDIDVVPASHAYGDVTLGNPVDQTFVVSNTGTADLSVSAATLTGTDPGQFSIVSGGAPFTVIPGQTQNVVVSFNPSSLGAKSASLSIASNDPDENPLVLPLSGTGVASSAPDIGVTPTNHNYGSVVVGTSASQTFVVSNTGTADLSVSATTLTGTDPGQFSIVSGGAPFTVIPGQTQNVVVSFNPSSLGAKSASLSIASDDPDENPLVVPLSGTGVASSAPDIGVTPTNHNYGSVVVGTSASQTFVVSNTGTADLSVSAATLTGTDPGQFSIVSGGAPPTFTLTPGQTRNLVVSFNPSSLSAKSASLSIASNDPDENPLVLPLSGTGVTTPPAATHEETRTGASSGLSVATTTALTGVTGHLYLAAISTRPSVTVLPAGVSGLGLAWTQVATQCSGRNATRVTVFKAQGTPSGNSVVTATFSSTATNAVISVSRYSGASTTDPIGNVIAGNTLGLNGACSGGTDNSTYSFNLTTTVAGAVIYGAAAERNRTHTPGASYFERSDLLQGSGGDIAGIATEDRNVTSASTVALNGTFSGTVDWAVIGVEIKP